MFIRLNISKLNDLLIQKEKTYFSKKYFHTIIRLVQVHNIYVMKL